MKSWERSIELGERAARHVARLQRAQTDGLVKALTSHRGQEIVEPLARRLEALEPIAAETLRDAQLHAFIRGAIGVADQIPGHGGGHGRIPPSSGHTPASAGAPGPALRFPQVEAGHRIISELTPLLPQDFEAASEEARKTAFTVARAQSIGAVEAIRDAIADDVRRGGTLHGFQKEARKTLRAALSDAQAETIYRTYVGRGHSAGQLAVWDSPGVRSQVPYLLYVSTNDSRVRLEHRAMEFAVPEYPGSPFGMYSVGGKRTAVYRADDPIWNYFWPPWAWNCRCLVVPLDVHDAAARGVREAVEWLKSGRPPANPEFVMMPPFRPPRGWVPTGKALSLAY